MICDLYNTTRFKGDVMLALGRVRSTECSLNLHENIGGLNTPDFLLSILDWWSRLRVWIQS